MAVGRAQLEVTDAGKVALRFNGREGLRLWVGDKQMELADTTVIDFPAGRHNLIVAVNLNERKQPLRLELAWKQLPREERIATLQARMALM